MASCEDVIELGSSDEETVPAPKKARPRPNAMVHIPNKLSGVTIKTPKQINPIKKLIGKGVTITKVNNKTNTNTHKFNVKKVVNPSINRNETRKKLIVPFGTPIVVQNSAFSMASIRPRNIKVPVITNKTVSVVNPIKVPQIKSLNNLPPTLTITKTSSNKRPATSAIANVKRKNMKITPKRDNLLTVELDDDEPETSSSTTNPQWYLRPEDQDTKSLEEKNNAEPDKNKFIEITIEDSPVKPVQDKRTNEIGTELAITIDDSPCKSTPAKAPVSPGSDDEKNKTRKEPHSKKKLNYPQQTTIEIELEPLDSNTHQNISSNVMDVEENNLKSDTVLVTESSVKKIQPVASTSNNDDTLKTKSVATNQISSQSGEFHPVYQEFIDLCFKLENSTDMQTIVEKKIKSYYRQVPKEYTESEEFIDIVSSKILAMKAGPEKLYLYIKDIVDELNLQRKMAKAQPAVKDAREIEAEKFQYGEDSEFDSKRQRQIRKLEKTLKKLHRAIQKLEEQEVDFDDDEDSVYLLTERYKERMVRVHAKFCQLTNTKMPSEPKIHIEARPGQPAGPAKRLEKWINKKVPIGKPLPFPDFHDVLRCVKEANTEDKLGWNDVDIMEEARDLFTRCGKKLQRRRQENEWRLAASRISSELDPAETSEDLKRKLEMNKQLASKKETEVFNKYADKQNKLKLEAVEIGDKEAEESPVESEEEEPPEEETKTLENKEKRKERLKRLIEEKSKRNSTSTENPKEQIDSQSGAEETTESINKQTEKQSETKDVKVDNDAVEIDTDSQDAKNIEDKSLIFNDIAHSISDASKIDSDIDELHLLQKLHSDDVNTSTVESSDSESCIDLSDSLPSSDNKGNPTSDIISIENSSYSESEQKTDDDRELKKVVTDSKKMDTNELLEEIGCSSSGIQINKTNNEEYNESVESILLASTDDEADGEKKNVETGETNSIAETNTDENNSVLNNMVLEDNSADKTVDEHFILQDRTAPNASKYHVTENKLSDVCSTSEQAFEKKMDVEITANNHKNDEASDNEQTAEKVDEIAEKDSVETTFDSFNKVASEDAEMNSMDKQVQQDSVNVKDKDTQGKLPEVHNGIKDNAKENESLSMSEELGSHLVVGTGNEHLTPEVPAETT